MSDEENTKFAKNVERHHLNSKIVGMLYASLVNRDDGEKNWWECTTGKDGILFVGHGDLPEEAMRESMMLYRDYLRGYTARVVH